MPQEAPNKARATSESSDWQCTNCGATLTGVNNEEIVARSDPGWRCICNGIFKNTRNNPFTRAATGGKAQRRNQGGGRSWPGP